MKLPFSLGMHADACMPYFSIWGQLKVLKQRVIRISRISLKQTAWLLSLKALLHSEPHEYITHACTVPETLNVDRSLGREKREDDFHCFVLQSYFFCKFCLAWKVNMLVGFFSFLNECCKIHPILIIEPLFCSK